MKLSDKSEAVVDRLISEMEKGKCPWRRPWSTLGEPRSYSGRPYHGINLLLLSMAPGMDPAWLTFHRAKALGGHVRKGEKAMPVLLWKILEQEDEENDEKEKKVPLLVVYSVFSISQVEGVPDPAWLQRIRETKKAGTWNPIEQAEALVSAWTDRPAIKHGGDRSCYCPETDEVFLPDPQRFKRPDYYYAAMFHELIHSTGHKSRLAREEITVPNKFGDHAYSREELVAEIGSAMILAHLGLDSAPLDENAAAYLRGWMRRLENDKSMIVTAGSAGRRAAQMILGDQAADIEEAA